MKKNSIMLETLLIIVFPFLYSCEGVKQKKYTSKEFLNHTVIKKEDYTKDSIQVVKQLKGFLLKQEDFFHNKAYFNSLLSDKTSLDEKYSSVLVDLIDSCFNF